MHFVRQLLPAFIFCFGLGFVSCKDGDDDNDNFAVVIEVPSLSVGPAIASNEVFLIRFDGPIDAGLFDGLRTDDFGAPIVLEGPTRTSFAPVRLMPYVDQTAARTVFQILDNDTSAAVFGVVGRVVGAPDTLAFWSDTAPSTVDIVGETPVTTFEPGGVYHIYIPSASDLRVRGREVAEFGSLTPVPDPVIIPPEPIAGEGLRDFFSVFNGLLGSLALPVVESVGTLGQIGQGTIDLPATGAMIFVSDTIVVTFNKAMDTSSLDRQENVLVRNLDITVGEATAPVPMIVPTTAIWSDSQRVLMLTPQPSFGPGPYSIEIAVGVNADPRLSLRDLPVGGTSRVLDVPALRTVTTPGSPLEPLAMSLSENFATSTFEDVAFMPVQVADWNTMSPGRLLGASLTGAADPMAADLGSRRQITIEPPGPTQSYFSPFDDDGVNNLFVNPNGGSRTMLLYTQSGGELPTDLVETIELVEWRVSFGPPLPAIYDGFTMRMGHTAAASIGFGSLNSAYDLNYNFSNPQNQFLQPTEHPAGSGVLTDLADTPVTVVSPMSYVPPPVISSFVPFPLLSLPFDFVGNRLEQGPLGILPPSLLIDIDIAPPVAPSGNFLVGNSPLVPAPFRRLVGQSGATVAFANDGVVYHMRLTTVPRRSQAQSLFYDLGVDDPDYLALDFMGQLTQMNASTVVEVQAAPAIMNGEPIGTATDVITYIDGFGNADTSALSQLDGNRFFRFRASFEADTTTNFSTFIEGFLLGYTP